MPRQGWGAWQDQALLTGTTMYGWGDYDKMLADAKLGLLLAGPLDAVLALRIPADGSQPGPAVCAPPAEASGPAGGPQTGAAALVPAAAAAPVGTGPGATVALAPVAAAVPAGTAPASGGVAGMPAGSAPPASQTSNEAAGAGASAAGAAVRMLIAGAAAAGGSAPGGAAAGAGPNAGAASVPGLPGGGGARAAAAAPPSAGAAGVAAAGAAAGSAGGRNAKHTWLDQRMQVKGSVCTSSLLLLHCNTETRTSSLLHDLHSSLQGHCSGGRCCS